MSSYTILAGTAPRSRRGLSLIEVLVSMVILAGVLLAMTRFGAALAHTSGTARITATAAQLVADRLETVKTAPSYAAIESLYVAMESNPTGYSGYTRNTAVLRIGGEPTDSIDYKIVTVEVTHAGLDRAVRKSTVIAPF